MRKPVKTMMGDTAVFNLAISRQRKQGIEEDIKRKEKERKRKKKKEKKTLQQTKRYPVRLRKSQPSAIEYWYGLPTA